jgi:hypothetical protein
VLLMPEKSAVRYRTPLLSIYNALRAAEDYLIYALGASKEFLAQVGFVRTGNSQIPIRHQNDEVEVSWLMLRLPVFADRAPDVVALRLPAHCWPNLPAVEPINEFKANGSIRAATNEVWRVLAVRNFTP